MGGGGGAGVADLYQKIPIWTSLPRGGVPTGTETEKDRKGKDKTVIWFEGLVGAVRGEKAKQEELKERRLERSE